MPRVERRGRLSLSTGEMCHELMCAPLQQKLASAQLEAAIQRFDIDDGELLSPSQPPRLDFAIFSHYPSGMPTSLLLDQ